VRYLTHPSYNIKLALFTNSNFKIMNISTNLADEIKLYLKQQANKGDLEAQTLLAQIEQSATSQLATVQQGIDVSLPDGIELGC
jgi:hypothetical protein